MKEIKNIGIFLITIFEWIGQLITSTSFENKIINFIIGLIATILAIGISSFLFKTIKK